jgi:hypothetical protein
MARQESHVPRWQGLSTFADSRVCVGASDSGKVQSVTATMSSRLMLGLVLVVACVGVLETVRSGHWDAVVLFAVVALVIVVMLARSWIGTPLVAVRADLVRWLDRCSAEADERVESVASRAIAAYRDGLIGDGVSGGKGGPDREP